MSDRQFDTQRVKWLGVDMQEGRGAGFWEYVDSKASPMTPRVIAHPWQAERSDGCLALASDGTRCSRYVDASITPFCEFHEPSAIEWMLARVDHHLVRAYRRDMDQARKAALLLASHPRGEGAFVYFYELPSAGVVKIGFSRRPRSRVAAFKSGHGCIFPEGITDFASGRLLGHIPGDQGLEADLHRRFATHRVAGEWFQHVGPVKAFIEHALAADGAVAS